MPDSTRVRAAAPGRVNLIGEHTDYNGGFVLPTAIPQQTRVELRRRAGRTVHVAQRRRQPTPAAFALGEERPRGDWLDYVQGVTWALRRDGFALTARLRSGHQLRRAAGRGLVVERRARSRPVARPARGLRLPDLDDVELAQLGQVAENDFVGARCGIMDQMAASLADGSTALFLDTRSSTFRRVPLPTDADLVVVHSGVTHGIAGGDYNTRRAECEAAAEQLGVPQLRDLIARRPAADRAAARAASASRAPRRDRGRARARRGHGPRRSRISYDWASCSIASHVSMRDDFEVSVPEVDLLVELGSGRSGRSTARA